MPSETRIAEEHDTRLETAAAIDPAASGEPRSRLASLDAFRGLTILLMLLVNNLALNGRGPDHLSHAAWNDGVRLADLVFPWFLLCVGIAVPYSMASARRRGVTGWALAGKVLGRVAGLFALGLLLESSIQHRPVFSLGVLQLIALAYGVGAALSLMRPAARLAASAALLAGYGLALKYVPVPGVGVPVFEEGTNLVRHLNDAYLSDLGLRGLPSVVPTAALVALGSLIGEAMRDGRRVLVRRIASVAAGGAVLALLGAWWNLALPYNKPVWTPAYILLAAGLGAMVLAVLAAMFDVRGRARWAYPLVVPGSNALLAYVGPILVKVLILQVWTVGPEADSPSLQQAWIDAMRGAYGPTLGGWMYTGSYNALVWIVLAYLHRRRWYLRL